MAAGLTLRQELLQQPETVLRLTEKMVGKPGEETAPACGIGELSAKSLIGAFSMLQRASRVATEEVDRGAEDVYQTAGDQSILLRVGFFLIQPCLSSVEDRKSGMPAGPTADDSALNRQQHRPKSERLLRDQSQEHLSLEQVFVAEGAEQLRLCKLARPRDIACRKGVANGPVWLAVGEEPFGGSLVKTADGLRGLDRVQSAAQRVAQQGMESEPALPAFKRNDKQVVTLQVLEELGCVRNRNHGDCRQQRDADLIENRGS